MPSISSCNFSLPFNFLQPGQQHDAHLYYSTDWQVVEEQPYAQQDTNYNVTSFAHTLGREGADQIAIRSTSSNVSASFVRS